VRPLRTITLTALAPLAGALLATGLGVTAAPTTYAGSAPPSAARGASPTPTAGQGARRSGWRPRPAEYPATVTRADLAIPMSDGVVLRGDLTLPARDDGTAVPGRFPVIVTITAYNKSAQGSSGLAGPGADFLVERGYAQLTVDARGTGSSEGQWSAFGARENRDSAEVVEWAHSRRRPWSDGRVGMRGPSYMGINQLFAAAQHPAGLRAIFPQVPAGDVYRDVVASGGQLDVGFMPLWLGLVTGTSVIPPAVAQSDPQSGFGAVFDHLLGAATFTAPLLPGAALDGETAYDGPFYRTRSPLRVVDRVRVPTFLVSGEHDLFQRGTPMLFDRLRARGVPARLVTGPWNHLQASAGTGLEKAGYGELAQLQLRWFDHWVRGRPDAGLLRDIAPVTYYEQGSGRWRRSTAVVRPRSRAESFRLSGSATNVSPGALTRSAPAPGTATVLPVPVSGLCTRSTDQWTAGLPGQLLADLPCFSDNGPNDRAGVAFDTAPVRRAVRLQGPIEARLYTSSSTGSGMLSVAVEDVAPDGTVHRLTAGWQVVDQRALDRRRSRYLDGRLIQPFHPFTAASAEPLSGTEPVDVEVFPTAAVIGPGHRLRLAVQAFDVPHLAPTLPEAGGAVTVLTIHAGPRTPSVLTIPAVG